MQVKKIGKGKTGRFILLSLALVLAVSGLNGQSYYDSGHIRYKDHVYKPNIRTVIFDKKGVENSQPVIALNGAGKLKLSFDDLQGGYKEFKYTIIHCTPGWQPSELFPSDYIRGIRDQFIENYKNSFNTYSNYTHYWLEFPTSQMKPEVSGNYVLKVYRFGDVNDLVLTRRFFVVESNKASISGEVKQATYAKYQQTKHEIDFKVSYGGLDVSDPFNEIKVTLRQNGRWDNMITSLKPQYIQNELLIYDYEEENIFDAGNEFRAFDLRSVKYTRQGVGKVYLDSFFNAVLYPDLDRSYSEYNSFIDINGSRIITMDESGNPNLEGEYVKVKFMLNVTAPVNEDERIYLFGALTDWQIIPRYQMQQPSGKEFYVLTAWFKQGYYNYHYAVVQDGSAEIDATYLEGSHYETENDYFIYVYFRDPFLDFYRLVGYANLNSGVEKR